MVSDTRSECSIYWRDHIGVNLSYESRMMGTRTTSSFVLSIQISSLRDRIVGSRAYVLGFVKDNDPVNKD